MPSFKFFKSNKLRTDRLIIRPYTEDDLLVFHEICRNPNIGNNGGWKPHESIVESEQILKYYFIQEPFRWAVARRDTKELIGSIGFSWDEKRTYDEVKSLGYWLNEMYWGQGYMTEAVRAVVKYAFENLNFEYISADCYADNFGSRRVLEKAGFEFEGTLHRGAKSADGKIHDLLCYFLCRD